MRTYRPDDGPEILLPLDRSLRDYAARMGELLQTLEQEEHRSQLEILRDIKTISGDLIRLRLARADFQSGTLPLEAGVKLVQGVRDMLAAAACAAVSPKAYYQARRPTVVTEYMQKVHLGQTEQGSYVVTVLSRVPPELVLGQQRLPLEPPEDPFERRVTMTLADALSAAREAADVAAVQGVLDGFEQGIARGISANLCEAIQAVGDTPVVERIDVSVAWAATRPLSRPVNSLISFPSDALPFVKEAGRLLRAIAPIEDVELRGVVTRLAKDPGANMGTVWVLGVVDSQVRHVRMDLPEPEYHMAIQAHDEERPVLCYGNLVKEGKGFVLNSPRGFTIEPSPGES
ncbi:MAG TPA: hypothetical protein GX517_09740 [Alicyclobacillus sp.]|nr:hypothetical protein [Alicyclobacillus sp.]